MDFNLRKPRKYAKLLVASGTPTCNLTAIQQSCYRCGAKRIGSLIVKEAILWGAHSDCPIGRWLWEKFLHAPMDRLDNVPDYTNRGDRLPLRPTWLRHTWVCARLIQVP